MKSNSRLFLALHTLSHMAGDPTRPRTSAEMAQHVGTNPVVVRRVLGRLKQAGLLSSEKGHAGGWRLAQRPESITLAHVYLALGESLVASDQDMPVSACSLEHRLQSRLRGLLQEVEESLIEKLTQTSIAQLGQTH